MFSAHQLLRALLPTSTGPSKSTMNSATLKRTSDTFTESNGSTSNSNPKKSRTSPEATEIRDKVQLWNMITTLSPTTMQLLLFQICHDNPALSKHVNEAHQSLIVAERAKPAVNFDAYSRSCFHAVNTRCARMRSSAQLELVGEVCDELESARTSILEKAGPDTKWETRRNALEVMRKISKSVMMCEEPVIRREIMKDGVELGYWAEAMLKLAREMTEEEREMFKEEGWYEKLVELQTECEWELEMEGLREVYELFDGPDDGEGEDGGEEVEDAGQGGESQASDDSVMIVPPPRTKVFSISELS